MVNFEDSRTKGEAPRPVYVRARRGRGRKKLPEAAVDLTLPAPRPTAGERVGRRPSGWLPSTPNTLTYKDIQGARETELILRCKAGDAAAGSILVQAHASLIYYFAHRYIRNASNADRDDVMQAARMGFLHAISKFEPERGFKLATYAKSWVMQAASRYLDDTKTMIGVPIHILDARRKAKRENIHISNVEGVGEAAIETADYNYNSFSLDAPVGDGDSTLLDHLGDPLSRSPELDVVEAEEQAHSKQMIEAALVGLSARELEVIRRTELSNDPETLKAIGDGFGLSRERIRQIQVKALTKIKARLLRIREREAKGPRRRARTPLPPRPAEAPERRRRGGRPNTSGFRGVCFDKKTQKWRVSVYLNGKQVTRGEWPSPVEAGHAYDKAALELKGPDAELNFPENRARLLIELRTAAVAAARVDRPVRPRALPPPRVKKTVTVAAPSPAIPAPAAAPAALQPSPAPAGPPRFDPMNRPKKPPSRIVREVEEP